MKLFDYLVCLTCAWDITRGIFEPDLLQLGIGVGAFFLWERFRIWEESDGQL